MEVEVLVFDLIVCLFLQKLFQVEGELVLFGLVSGQKVDIHDQFVRVHHFHVVGQEGIPILLPTLSDLYSSVDSTLLEIQRD